MLGLEEWALRAVGIGASKHGMSFPMYDASGEVCGIRIRTLEGVKRSIKGSRNGIFTEPAVLAKDRVITVCEGPTDTAAAIQIGLTPIGRPDNQTGGEIVASLVRRLKPREVVIMCDRDEVLTNSASATFVGATALVRSLPNGVSSRIVLPPHGIKDLRQWVLKGCTARDVLASPIELIRRMRENRDVL